MKLQAHVEERERDTFALVLDRADGRFGSLLERSTLDCAAGPARASVGGPPGTWTLAEMRTRCGMSMSGTTIVTGGAPLANLAVAIQGLAGRLINDRTGLTGLYAFSLSFSLPRSGRGPEVVAPGEPPDIFTALREQLGLKLQPEKSMVPVLVVDHIERPTPN